MGRHAGSHRVRVLGVHFGFFLSRILPFPPVIGCHLFLIRETQTSLFW